MQRAKRDMIIASCVCVMFTSAAITVAAYAGNRKVSAAEIIVLSDDIHKKTTEVEHAGDNPSGVDSGSKSKPAESKSVKSKSKTRTKA